MSFRAGVLVLALAMPMVLAPPARADAPAMAKGPTPIARTLGQGGDVFGIGGRF